MPRNKITMTPGTMPTTARLDGRLSIPLDTISAIMRAATSCQLIVRYWIWYRADFSVGLGDTHHRKGQTYLSTLLVSKHVLGGVILAPGRGRTGDRHSIAISRVQTVLVGFSLDVGHGELSVL